MARLYLHQLQVKEGGELQYTKTHELHNDYTHSNNYIFGRNDCCIGEQKFPFISDKHVELCIDNDNYLWLRDLKSSGGTFVYGERLKPQTSRKLICGDRFSLCKLELGGLLFELSKTPDNAKERTMILRSSTANNNIELHNVWMKNCKIAGGNISELTPLKVESIRHVEELDYEHLKPLDKKGAQATIGLYFDKKTTNVFCGKEYHIDNIRCKREVLLLKQLEHENIIKPHDFIETTEHKKTGRVQTEQLLVMEYIRGCDLEEWNYRNENLYRNSCYIAAMVKWMIQITDAFCYLHQHQIFHRDVKPNNILIECNAEDIKDYRPVIVDFGLARGVNDTRSIVGNISGHIDYIPPEKMYMTEDQIIQEAIKKKDQAQLDQRQDIIDRNHDSYALGCTFAMLLKKSKENSLVDIYIQTTLQQQTCQEEQQRSRNIEVFKSRLQLWMLVKNDVDLEDLSNRVLTTNDLDLSQLTLHEKKVLCENVQNDCPPYWQGEIVDPTKKETKDIIVWPVVSIQEDKKQVIAILQEHITWRGEVLQPGIVVVGSGGDLDSFNLKDLEKQWQKWSCGDNDPRTLYLQALIAESKVKYIEAENYYRRAIKLFSKDTPWLYGCFPYLQEKKHQRTELTCDLLQDVSNSLEDIIKVWPNELISDK